MLRLERWRRKKLSRPTSPPPTALHDVAQVSFADSLLFMLQASVLLLSRQPFSVSFYVHSVPPAVLLIHLDEHVHRLIYIEILSLSLTLTWPETNRPYSSSHFFFNHLKKSLRAWKDGRHNKNSLYNVLNRSQCCLSPHGMLSEITRRLQFAPRAS